MSTKVHKDTIPSLEAIAAEVIGPGNYVKIANEVIGPFGLNSSKSGLHAALSGIAGAADSKAEIFDSDPIIHSLAPRLESTQTMLESSYRQAARDSSLFFRLTCGFSIVGFLFVVAGAALVVLGRSSAGITGVWIGAIPEAVAIIFLNKDRELRRQLDVYSKRLAAHHHILTLMDLANSLTDLQARDKLRANILMDLAKRTTTR